MNGMHARSGVLWDLIRENPVLLVIAGIGFSVSFQTIAHEAAAQGMPGPHVFYPLLIDAGILGMIAEARKAIDDDRSDLVPRLLAWLLAAFTIYVNAHGSPRRDWVGIALHVVAPGLWVAFLELTRWRKLRTARDARGDRIPRARWLLSPLRTAGMRRRMILNDITSYPVASAREGARLAAVSLMPAVYGERWKRTAPALLLHHLASGTMPADLALACDMARRGHPPAVAEMVETWVTAAQSAGVSAAARAQRERAATEAERASGGAAELAPGPASGVTSGPAAGTAAGRTPDALPKLTARRSRGMTPDALVPWVSALLVDPAVAVSLNTVIKELHVGRAKASEALRLARKSRMSMQAGAR